MQIQTFYKSLSISYLAVKLTLIHNIVNSILQSIDNQVTLN